MTVMTNVVLVLKDSEGNIGIVKQLTDNDIIKIANAITDVGQVVDPATHMPIEATTASVGVVQLATAQDITNGTAGKVVDAKELNDFAQTLPAANGVTDVSSGDNSNQLVVSRIGGSKTLTIDNVEHAGTAASADSVSWDNVSGKPTKVSQFTNDSGYITTDGAAYPRRVGGVTMNFNWSGQGGQPTWLWGGEDGTNMYVYNPANFSVNYANSAGYVQGNNNSANAANALLRSGSGRTDSSPEGDTWIFWDELGGSDAPWGIKHNQLANTIGFYGAGTETSSINLSNGYFSGSCNYANSSGNADTVDGSHAWQMQTLAADGSVHGSSSWLLQCQHNVDGDSYFKLYCGDKSIGTKVDRASSAGYADSAGNSDTLDGYHEYSFLRNRGSTATNGEGTLWSQIGIKEYYNALPDGLSGLYSYGETVSFAGNGARFDIYCSHQSSNGDGLYYRSGWGDDKKDWRRFIDSANIGSQSVNYANSAGSVAWGNVSGRPDIWIG